MTLAVAFSELASCALDHYVRGMPDGDDDSGRALARAAEPMRNALRGYFRRRVKSAAEIDDLVQDVFVRIAARGDAGPVENLQGYVFQTASSVLIDHVRRRGARRADAHVEFDPERDAEADVDPEHILTRKQDLQVVGKALQALPVRTRTIFVMYRLEGRTLGEIAAHEGISVSAVQKHVVRALSSLSAAVEASR